MKRILFVTAALVAALVLVAFVGCETANAQVPAGALIDGPPNILAQGRMLKVTALDSIWFTKQQYVGSSVVDFTTGDLPQRLYPIRGFFPESGEEPILRPTAFLLYADSPFRWKGFADGGDSLQTIQTYVDTVVQAFTSGAIAYSAIEYPCWTWIYGGIDTLRVTPTSSDTLHVVPFVLRD